MRFGQIAHHLGEQLQADQEAVQRILVKLIAAPENVVEDRPVVREVAQQHRLGELGLVLEVIEEAALGDADRGDQLLDRGRGKALGQHGGFRDFEDALAGVFAGRFEHGELYHESSCAPARPQCCHNRPRRSAQHIDFLGGFDLFSNWTTSRLAPGRGLTMFAPQTP